MSNLLKSKLSIDDLKKRSNEITNELLNSISGGTENDCHVYTPKPIPTPDTTIRCDNI